jgi:hypothetical protein
MYCKYFIETMHRFILEKYFSSLISLIKAA